MKHSNNHNSNKHNNNDSRFFESLNRITGNQFSPSDASSFSSSSPSMYTTVDAQTRRNIKRQRKAEKRARKMETQRHMDKFSLHPITPLTENQTTTFESFRKGKHLMLHGYAGTGKTFISLYLALENIFSEKGSDYKKIVVVRSVVPSRDMGYLPGSANEKMRVYEEPYEEICDSLFGQGSGYNILKDRHLFEFTTTSYLRGVTFSDSIVIVDEMQNMTFQELDTVMTRIGENCRIVFCGDFRQTDLERETDKVGLHKFMGILHKLKGFVYVEFGREDIVRSSIVKDYIIARTELEHHHHPKGRLVTTPMTTSPTDATKDNWYNQVLSDVIIRNMPVGNSGEGITISPFLSGFSTEGLKGIVPMTREEINNSTTLIGKEVDIKV